MSCGTGCGDCSTSSGGCETAKTPQRAFIDETLARLYPARVWGQLDDGAAMAAGISEAEGKRLARAMSQVAKAPTFYRAASPDDLCATVYVLCVGREPALVDVRDGLAAPDLTAGPVRERYLRVALSTVARAAAIQEIALELDADDDPAQPGAWLRELPLPGVYDAKLLKRMRALVDLLNASGVQHLDFGLCDQPVDGGQPGEYTDRFSAMPTVGNYLFFGAPTQITQESYLALGTAGASDAAYLGSYAG